VAVAGDHGESRGEHHELFHSRTIYEGAMRVPLILNAPGVIAAGGVMDAAVVSLADLLPTTLDLLGMLDPSWASSVDGLSLCTSRTGSQRMVYLETMGTYLSSGWAPLFGACRLGAKYILAPREEYYDLDADPREQHNLLATSGTTVTPTGARDLKAFLDEVLADTPSPAEVVAGATPMDAETRSQLAALGYISEESPERSLAEAPDPKDMLPLFHLYTEGKEALDRGALRVAEERARTILERAPRDRAALRLLGDACLRQDRPAEAEVAYRARTDIRPDAVGLAFLANAIMLQGRFQEAQEALDQAVEIDPTDGIVHFARGDLMFIQKRLEEAAAAYEEAARVDPVRFGTTAGQRATRIRKTIAQAGQQ
jgi:Flp pilus assembly protein TadD